MEGFLLNKELVSMLCAWRGWLAGFGTHQEKPNVLAVKTHLKRVEGSAKLEIKSEVEVTDSRQVEDAIKYLTNAGIDIDDL